MAGNSSQPSSPLAAPLTFSHITTAAANRANGAEGTGTAANPANPGQEAPQMDQSQPQPTVRGLSDPDDAGDSCPIRVLVSEKASGL